MENGMKQSLYIPQGLKTRVEIFDGFGKEELFKTILFVGHFSTHLPQLLHLS